MTGWPKNLETGNNLEFDNLGKKKNLEKPGILYNGMEKPGISYNRVRAHQAKSVFLEKV